MTFKVFTGPPGSERISPLEKDQWLYKEFSTLDDAFSFAQHMQKRGAIPLLIEGDDGTQLGKYEIADALEVREREVARP